MARYRSEGVRCVLVCCTGGEAGDILNPALDTPEVKQRLAEVRMAELEKAVDVIGYNELIMLGYRDSGMPDTPTNADPRSFAQAPIGQAVGRLVAEIRRARPQVIVTYNEDQRGYPHPDHLRVHEISVAAFDAAGNQDLYPEAGPAFQPLKMYYNVWSRARMLATHAKFLELGLESPFDARWMDRPHQDDAITTSIDISGHADVRRDALLAHATQVDPTSPFWFGLPPEVARTVHPIEEYALARDLTGADRVELEDDLFDGVGDAANR